MDREAFQRNDIDVTHRLVDASNATLLGYIEGAGQVIYKPIAGERPLWDFPQGTLADREVAAFKISEALGLNLVPYTILREGPFGPGMVQEWIEVDPAVDVIAFGQSDERRLRSLAIFDALINNTDRKFGHLLISREGVLYGCDHGVTFHHECKLRTVLWQFSGESFNEEEVALLQRAASESEKFSLLLHEHLQDDEINAFFHRLELLLATRKFPHPSTDWPAIPWPPV